MDASRTLISCTCADDVAVAWEHINSMSEISFDVILMASEQTIDFSLQAQECRTRGCLAASSVRDTLLRIYSKLVDLLEAAVAAYAATTRQFPNTLASPSTDVKGRKANSSSWDSRTPPARRVACLPSKMHLGEHELDDQQCGSLALDLVCRTLGNFADVLRRMGRRGNEDLNKVDERLLKILSRVTRLADEAGGQRRCGI